MERIVTLDTLVHFFREYRQMETLSQELGMPASPRLPYTNKEPGPRGPDLDLLLLGALHYAIAFRVPKMPKVNELFLSFKIGLAKGEHLNFRSL